MKEDDFYINSFTNDYIKHLEKENEKLRTINKVAINYVHHLEELIKTSKKSFWYCLLFYITKTKYKRKLKKRIKEKLYGRDRGKDTR